MIDSKTIPQEEPPQEILGAPTREARFAAALDELLRHLEEEAAEVIQACTKMGRFGPGGQDPRVENGPLNHQALAMELGQLMAVWHALDALEPSLLRAKDVMRGRDKKFERMAKELKHSTVTFSLVEGVRACLK